MILLANELVDGAMGQETFGGLDVKVRRNAFGRQVDSFETDLPFAGVGSVHAVFIRAPWVETTHSGVEILSSIEIDGVVHAVAVRQKMSLLHPSIPN